MVADSHQLGHRHHLLHQAPEAVEATGAQLGLAQIGTDGTGPHKLLDERAHG